MQEPTEELVIGRRDGPPIYRQVADFLQKQIENRVFDVGSTLPGQRDLAQELGVNTTTVSRAYEVLQDIGLIVARPRIGSVVVSRQAAAASARYHANQLVPARDGTLIDLTLNRPATGAFIERVRELLPEVMADTRFVEVLDYHSAGGPEWARTAASSWLTTQMGIMPQSPPVITNGAQHALACVLSALTRTGDLVLADSITYQGLLPLCQERQINIGAVAMDQQGTSPEALERAIQNRRPRALFLTPSFHNPTGITMPEERRREIATIAVRYGIHIIEDGVYAPLLATAIPSIASMAPELTIYISSLSKCVAPGLRMGFAVGPPVLEYEITAALRTNCWSTSPLTALLATSMMEKGAIDSLVSEQKKELTVRQSLAKRKLRDLDTVHAATCPHVWIPLPRHWRPDAFAHMARTLGVAVLGSDSFNVDPMKRASGVRVNLSSAGDRAELVKALSILVDIIDYNPRASSINSQP